MRLMKTTSGIKRILSPVSVFLQSKTTSEYHLRRYNDPIQMYTGSGPEVFIWRE